MYFMEAVRRLRSTDIDVAWTPKLTENGIRLYRVQDKTSAFPPLWLTPKAVCRMAELMQIELGGGPAAESPKQKTLPLKAPREGTFIFG